MLIFATMDGLLAFKKDIVEKKAWKAGELGIEMIQSNVPLFIETRYCPGPLMELIKAIKEEDVGKVDESSAKDIPEWVKKAGHELVGVFKEED